MNSTKHTLQKIAGVFQIIVGIFVIIIGFIGTFIWQIAANFLGDISGLVESFYTPDLHFTTGLSTAGYVVFILIIAVGIAMTVLGGKLTAYPVNNVFTQKSLVINPKAKPINDKLAVSIAAIVINLLFLFTALGVGFSPYIHLAPLLIALLAGIALFLKHPENSPEAIKAKIEAQRVLEEEQRRIQKQKEEEKEQALKMQQQQQMQFQQMMQLQMQNMFTPNQSAQKNTEPQPKQANESVNESKTTVQP
ncbi:MAG: hypothetical protein LBT20_06190 [Clostridiales bacterium]|jgi:hypothetical protein|nr:hypothetical protein [Clostridiales bacterium]